MGILFRMSDQNGRGMDRDEYEKVIDMRLEILRLHNLICENKMEEDGEYALDLFALFGEHSDMHAEIIHLAVQLEGMVEGMRFRTRDERMNCLAFIEQRLCAEMRKIASHDSKYC